MESEKIKQLGAMVMASKKKYDDTPLYLVNTPVQSQPQPLGDAFAPNTRPRLPWASEVLERVRTERSAKVSPLLQEWMAKNGR